MTWQELVSLREAGNDDPGFLKMVVKSKDGEEYTVDVIAGAVDRDALREAADALKDDEAVYVKINFDRYPHPTAIRVGEWD